MQSPSLRVNKETKWRKVEGTTRSEAALWVNTAKGAGEAGQGTARGDQKNKWSHGVELASHCNDCNQPRSFFNPVPRLAQHCLSLSRGSFWLNRHHVGNPYSCWRGHPSAVFLQTTYESSSKIDAHPHLEIN